MFCASGSGVAKYVIRVPGNELIHPGIDFYQKILFPAGQCVRDSLEIRPARSAELDFS
jgi:hypothetical protein